MISCCKCKSFSFNVCDKSEAGKQIIMHIEHKAVYSFAERPQEMLKRHGYGMCARHFHRFWNNPPEAHHEWQIALRNYESAHSSRDPAFVNFIALSFQMARISLLRFRCFTDDAVQFAATTLLLVDAFESLNEGEVACATLLEALSTIQDCEDVWPTSPIDYEGIATQMVIEARAVHKKYNRPNHLRLVWSNPQSDQLH